MVESTKQNINFKIKYNENQDKIALTISIPDGLKNILKSCAVLTSITPYQEGIRYKVKTPITQGLFLGWDYLFDKTLLDSNTLTIYKEGVQDVNRIITNIKSQISTIISNYYSIQDREVQLTINIIEEE